MSIYPYPWPPTDKENIGKYSATRIKAINIAIKIRIAGSIRATMIRQVRVHIVFIEFGDAGEHGRKRSAGFPDFDHLQSQIRHEARGREAAVQ